MFLRHALPLRQEDWYVGGEGGGMEGWTRRGEEGGSDLRGGDREMGRE